MDGDTTISVPAVNQILLCQRTHPRKKSIFVCFFLLAGKHRERENDANGATAGLPLFFERSLSETKRTARYLPRKYAFRSDYISFCVRQQLEMKKRRKYKKQTDVIYSRKDSERKCAKPMGRKSKEQLRQERVKKLQSERAKRYYEKQQQRGKVRIVRWTTQDEKQFLDEFIFPNLPKLVEKWKAQQKEMPENQPEKTTL